MLLGLLYAALMCLPCVAGAASAPTFKQLVEELQSAEPKIQRKAARRLSLLPASQLPSSLVPLLEQLLQNPSSEPAFRNFLCDVVAKMGLRAVAVLPTLREMVLQDPSALVQLAAVNAMSHMGDKAVVILAHLIRTAPEITRTWAAGALSRMGKAAYPAVPVLIPLLTNKRWTLRWSAVIALSRIGHYPPSLRRILLPMLKSPHQLIRVTVCRMFGRMGWKGAIPGLLEAADTADWLMRKESIKALGLLGVTTPLVRKKVTLGLADAHDWVRAVSIEAWTRLYPQATALEAIRALRNDSSPRVRQFWLKGVARLSLSDKSIEGFLLGGFGDKAWTVRKQAAQALGARPRLSAATFRAMLAQFRRDNGFVKQGLMLAFQQMGARASAAVPILIEHFQRRNRLLHRWLQDTILKIGPDAIPALDTGLRSNSWQVCRAVARALVALGPAALPALQGALRGASYKRRQWAAYALGKIGLAARAAMPALERATRDKHPMVRNFASFAISQIQAAITQAASQPKAAGQEQTTTGKSGTSDRSGREGSPGALAGKGRATP